MAVFCWEKGEGLVRRVLVMSVQVLGVGTAENPDWEELGLSLRLGVLEGEVHGLPPGFSLLEGEVPGLPPGSLRLGVGVRLTSMGEVVGLQLG